MEDLSRLAADGPWTGSMAATNTVTEHPAFSGQGTPSESTANESAGEPKRGTTGTLTLNYPPGRIKGSTYGPSAVAWKATEAGNG
jgi:hypothetical protein